MAIALKKKDTTKAPKAEAASAGKDTVGVEWFAKKLDLGEFTVRVKLRALNAPKNGRSYAFTKTEAEKLLKKMQAMNASE